MLGKQSLKITEAIQTDDWPVFVKPKPISRWERFLLRFVRGEWLTEGEYSLYVKWMRGRAYILKERTIQ